MEWTTVKKKQRKRKSSDVPDMPQESIEESYQRRSDAAHAYLVENPGVTLDRVHAALVASDRSVSYLHEPTLQSAYRTVLNLETQRRVSRTVRDGRVWWYPADDA
jgi:hypothetical protein